MEVMEVMYRIDEIEIDDSYFMQLDDLTSRERTFMNHKSVRFLEDYKKEYVDANIKNEPKFAITFQLHSQGRRYERQVYFLIDLLGKVGGFAGAIEFIVALILYTFTKNLTDTKFVDLFTNSLIDVTKSFEDL
jgi:hypothetical protein